MNKKLISGIFSLTLLFSFITSPQVFASSTDLIEREPVVRTGVATSPTNSSINLVLNNFRNINGSKSAGVMYSTDENVEIDVQTQEVKNYTSTFSAVIKNLNQSTTYYYCAFVKTQNETYKGEIKSFKTLGSLTISKGVTTGNAVSITSDSATIESNSYKNIFLPYVSGIGYSKTSTLDADKKVSTFKFSKFSMKLTNLEPNTIYYYYTFVNSGNGKTYKGELKSFTTLPE